MYILINEQNKIIINKINNQHKFYFILLPAPLPTTVLTYCSKMGAGRFGKLSQASHGKWEISEIFKPLCQCMLGTWIGDTLH
jgi:hypothetical protein